MANNWFNFEIPLFNTRYGTDWDDFQTIIEDNVDYIMDKTYQLYWLYNPDYFTTRVVEIVLNSLSIEYSSVDTLETKKYKVRKFLTETAYKGLGDLYLDAAEAVVGVRGTITTGTVGGGSQWPATWGSQGNTNSQNLKWSTVGTVYEIYINPKTLDNTELDLIQQLYREGMMYPAFYQIYLVDDDYNILRTI